MSSLIFSLLPIFSLPLSFSVSSFCCELKLQRNKGRQGAEERGCKERSDLFLGVSRGTSWINSEMGKHLYTALWLFCLVLMENEEDGCYCCVTEYGHALRKIIPACILQYICYKIYILYALSLFYYFMILITCHHSNFTLIYWSKMDKT